MRLGVVGMLPGVLDEITPAHLDAIQALRLTGAGTHVAGAHMHKVSVESCRRVRQLFAEKAMDLVQFGVGYRECLFDPDAAVRDEVITQIEQGITVAHELGAHVVLIRTGSLSPRGSYSPTRANHEPASRQRLLDSLKRIARAADAAGQTVAVETHVLTIMNSPEVNAEIVGEIGSPRVGVIMDYVNHFQALHQVYESTARLNHIFDVMGSISPVGHCKDISVRDGFVTHFDEEIPGEGELDLATAMRRWHDMHPDGYMLLEHLPVAQFPLASQNIHRIIEEAGIPVS